MLSAFPLRFDSKWHIWQLHVEGDVPVICHQLTGSINLVSIAFFHHLLTGSLFWLQG